MHSYRLDNAPPVPCSARLLARRTLAASATLLAVTSLSAAQVSGPWAYSETGTISQTDVTASGAVPLPDGGFALISVDPLGPRWVQRFDAEARPRSTAASVAFLSPFLHPASGGNVVGFAPPNDVVTPLLRARLCRPAVAAGVALQLFSSQLGLDGHAPANRLLGRGRYGHYGELVPAGSSAPRSTMAWFDGDCNRRDLLHSSGGLQAKPAFTGDDAFVLESPAGGSGPRQLYRFSPEGMRWSRGDALADAYDIIPTADDGLLLSNRRLLQRWTAQGELRWTQPLAPGHPISTISDEPAGTVVLRDFNELGSFPLPQTLEIYDDSGKRVVSRELGEEKLLDILPSAGGDPLWRRRGPLGAPGSPLPPIGIVRIGNDGRLDERWRTGANTVPLAHLGNNRLLQHRRGADPAMQLVDMVSGEVRTLPPLQRPTPRRVVAIADAPGRHYVMVEQPGGVLEVYQLDATGVQRWKVRLPAPPGLAAHDEARELAAAADAAGLCLWRVQHRHSALTCLAEADGHQRFAWLPTPLDAAAPAPQLRLDSATRLSAHGIHCAAQQSPTNLSCVSSSLRRWQVDRHSGDRSETIIETGTTWLLPWPGQLGISIAFEPSGTLRLRAYSADGATLGSVLLGGEPGFPLAVNAAGDLLYGNAADGKRSTVRLRAFDGALRWETRLEPVESAIHVQGVHPLDGGDWLLWRRNIDTPTTRLYRLDGREGAIRWRTDIDEINIGIGRQLHPVANSNRLWVQRDLAPQGRVQLLDLESGQFIHAAALEDSLAGEPFAATVLADASASASGLLSAWLDRDEGRLQLRWTPTPALVAAPRAESLAGIWHPSDADGQGLLLEAVEPSGTLAGAWFTHTQLGGHHPSELRWFALSGAIDAAGVPRLDITEARGGRFGSGPLPSQRPIGTASLRREGCDRLTLLYRFAEGELAGLGGAAALQRTAGACTENAPAAASAQGLWYDPADDGEGLLLREVGAAGAPRLAGAWFTFDPDDSGNDPLRQHWFTLLGDVDANGAGRLTILRTVGGRFDKQPTQNSREVGTLTLQTRGCDRLAITYRFTDTLAAGEFAALQGEALLQRIGGCANAVKGR
jgi:hypothetical protein